MGNLTVKALTESKAKDRPYKLYDGNRLFLQVLPSGVKSWVIRSTENGKEAQKRIGRFPAMSLTEARRFASSLQPDNERKKAPTFRAVANDFIATNGPKRRPAYKLYQERRLADLESLLDRPIDEIDTAALRAELLKVRERSKHMAHRLRGLAANIFEHAISDLEIDLPRNPAKSLANTFKLEKQDYGRVNAVDPSRLPELWKAVCEYGGNRATRGALKFIFWTALRSRALRHAQWSWLNEDSTVLTVPKEYMKTRIEFRTPLPWQAREELEGLKASNCGSPFIFEAPQSKGPISDETLLGALKLRLGFPDQSVHGIRSLFSTIMNQTREKGLHSFSVDLIERQLAHALGKVRGAYMRSDYLEERAIMMQAWADNLDGLPFPRKRDAVADALKEANRLKRAEVFKR